MQSMEFTEIDDISTIESLLDDDRFVVEQKMDGTRVLARITGSGVEYLARNGQPLKHTAATQHLAALSEALTPLVNFCRISDSRVVLDGELLIEPGTYHVFDLPEWVIADSTERVMADLPYGRRRLILNELMQPLTPSPIVHIVRYARTGQEKRALLAATRDKGAEGVMIKDIGSPYESGKRVKHTVKVKHVKEADVVVLTAERGTTDAGNPSGSATFGVYDDAGHLVRLGSCSLIGKPDVKPGDVITVAYLYRQDDGGLVQPRLRTVRHDKDMTDCGLDQFPRYSREVI